MDKQEAARRLGAPEAEIAAVRDTDHGTVATHIDGYEYLITDGAVAFYLARPKGSDFPLFVPPASVDEPPAVDVDGDGVPDGTAAQILAWVGDDRDRAAQALAAERAKSDNARATLVARLEKLVG